MISIGCRGVRLFLRSCLTENRAEDVNDETRGSESRHDFLELRHRHHPLSGESRQPTVSEYYSTAIYFWQGIFEVDKIALSW